jgi:hypothetical protein
VDTYITELRLKAVRELPWPIPATVLLEMTEEDLDRLAAASDRDYWRILNAIVTRVQNEAQPRDAPPF